jgi:hypothetical protein
MILTLATNSIFICRLSIEIKCLATVFIVACPHECARTANICGSDLHMYEGRTDVETGKILWHENLGEVIESEKASQL